MGRPLGSKDKGVRAVKGTGERYAKRYIYGTQEKPNKRGSNHKYWKSSVDPRLTKDPVTGKRACGAIRRQATFTTSDGTTLKGKAAWIASGLTVEDLLNNYELYKHWICRLLPNLGGRRREIGDRKANERNGRCIFHGANAGLRITSGRFSSLLPEITLAELEAIKEKGHQDLNDELSILTKMMQDIQPAALAHNECYLLIKGRVASKIERVSETLEAYDVEGCKKAIADLKELVKEADITEKAQRELRQLIKEYANVFDTEIDRRSASGEYVSKREVVVGYSAVFHLCAKYIPDEYKDKCESELVELITRGDYSSLPAKSSASRVSDFIRFKDTDADAAIDAVFTESCPDTV